MDLKRAQENVSRLYDMKIEEVERNLLELEQQLGINPNSSSATSAALSIAQQKQKSQITSKKEITKKGSATTTVSFADEEAERPALVRPTPAPTKHLNQPIKQQRYKELTTITAEQPKHQKRAPEISEKWAEMFAQKPDPMQFYDAKEFNPVCFDKRDFKTGIHLERENTVFNDTMDTFALSLL